MNDADLEKLIVKPGLLKPAFDRNITAYQVTLESSAKQITITPVTRDTDASWIIVVSVMTYISLPIYQLLLMFCMTKPTLLGNTFPTTWEF